MFQSSLRGSDTISSGAPIYHAPIFLVLVIRLGRLPCNSEENEYSAIETNDIVVTNSSETPTDSLLWNRC
jgi:hypothetical protein